jgi:hypothetical protein
VQAEPGFSPVGKKEGEREREIEFRGETKRGI